MMLTRERDAGDEGETLKTTLLGRGRKRELLLDSAYLRQLFIPEVKPWEKDYSPQSDRREGVVESEGK